MHHLTDQLQQYLRRYPTEAATRQCLALIRSQPNCLNRSCYEDGHFTASAWVINSIRDKCLLIHHQKFNKWLQLGGHVEGNQDLLAEARREVKEESGLEASQLSLDIFDIDIHKVPAYNEEPHHRHYDIRFLLTADDNHPLHKTSESHEIRWVRIKDITELTQEESVLRMARKQESLSTRRENTN